jgi:hypothetical protein
MAVDLTESDRSSGCNCGLNTLQTEILKSLKAGGVSAKCPFYAILCTPYADVMSAHPEVCHLANG